MVGIILCSHADFCVGIKNSVEMISGAQENLVAVPFDGNTQLEDYGAQIKAEVDKMEDGCIILCDIQNGTPYNASLMAIAYTDNIIISGMSLPMLLTLVISRNQEGITVEELANSVINQKDDFVAKICSKDIFG